MEATIYIEKIIKNFICPVNLVNRNKVKIFMAKKEKGAGDRKAKFQILQKL